MSCPHVCLLCSRQALKQLFDKAYPGELVWFWGMVSDTNVEHLSAEDCYLCSMQFACCRGIGLCPCVDAVMYGTGEVSFHSGWTFHQAAGNSTDAPREVFTIIFMDKDMIMAEPTNHNQRLDQERSALQQDLKHLLPWCSALLLLCWLACAHADTIPTMLQSLHGALPASVMIFGVP